MNSPTASIPLEETSPVYFDRSGQAIAPEGCVEVETEAAWLRVALQRGPLLVRGRSVEKASLFYAGRGRAMVELQSPREALDSLGVEAVGWNWIRTQWGDEFAARFARLEQPLRSAPLLVTLFPSAGVAWSASPSPEHAAHYLLWRGESAAVPDELKSFVNRQAAQWRETASPDDAALYAPVDSASARTLLRAWLGLEDAPNFPPTVGTFPLPVPLSWQEEARGGWLGEMAGRGVEVWNELRARPLLGYVLRREAAEALARFLNHHPDQISALLLSEIGESLSPETLAKLQDLVPPPAPPLLRSDASAEEALTWFHEAYWPFRRWQTRQIIGATGEESLAFKARQSTRIAARSFGHWYLKFYAHALSGGAGLEFLAGSRAKALRAAHSKGEDGAPAPVTLLVIVDGLHEGDAATLWARLKTLSGRLEALDRRARAFTAIPTITEIAKPSLWWGLPPREAKALTKDLGAFAPAAQGPEVAGTRAFAWPDSPFVGRELKEHADVRVLGEAQEGEVWMWNVLALDTAYHKNYAPATTEQEAGQVLELVAARIAAATEAVPEHLALRVVITADHGRLPGPSERCHPVPPGCKAHGRAALVEEVAEAPALAFTEQDFIWESDTNGERVWLHPGRFGLSAPAILCADENAFKAIGSHLEHFSHGGLWPEEVVVPWLVLARDQGTPFIHASVEGKAKAGGVGKLLIEARNGSEMSLILQEVRLVLGPRDERTMGVSQSLAPLGSLRAELALARWPDSVAAARAEATLVFSRPDGSRFSVPATPRLESEELYRASNILEDFDF